MYKTIFRNSAKVYKNIPTTEVLTLLTHHKGILKSITTSSAEQITFNRLTVEAFNCVLCEAQNGNIEACKR